MCLFHCLARGDPFQVTYKDYTANERILDVSMINIHDAYATLCTLFRQL